MAIIHSSRYPDNSEPASLSYPQGSARNNTSEGSGDGYGMEKDWINDILGFFQAIIKESSTTPTGNADTAVSSQYLTGLKSLDVPITRLSAGTMEINNSTSSMQLGSSSNDHTYLRSDGVTAYTADKTEQMKSEGLGLNCKTNDGGQERLLTPFSIAVSSLTWSADGDYFVCNDDIVTTKPYYSDLVMNGAKLSLRLTAGGTVIGSVVNVLFEEDSGFVKITKMKVETSIFSPSDASVDFSRLTGWWGRVLADAN